MIKRNYIDIDATKISSKIYRTLSFSRLVQIFEEEKNTLVAPSEWDDPFENFILNATFKRNGESLRHAARNRCYGQCWSSKYESDALWRIYSPDKSCVRIRTTYEKLATSLSSVCKKPDSEAYIGKVDYLTDKGLEKESKKLAENIIYGEEVGLAKTLLIKRNPFEHEKEIRLLFFQDDFTESPPLIHKYPVDPHSLIESIAVDPRATSELVEVYRHYLRDRLGFKGDFIQSKLYKPPINLVYELGNT
ncbi:MAG: DUF2971 domain-containing protein [Candidatus Sedimenticola sp. (ex Thyasira tokunagai)]